MLFKLYSFRTLSFLFQASPSLSQPDKFYPEVYVYPSFACICISNKFHICMFPQTTYCSILLAYDLCKISYSVQPSVVCLFPHPRLFLTFYSCWLYVAVVHSILLLHNNPMCQDITIYPTFCYWTFFVRSNIFALGNNTSMNIFKHVSWFLQHVYLGVKLLDCRDVNDQLYKIMLNSFLK